MNFSKIAWLPLSAMLLSPAVSLAQDGESGAWEEITSLTVRVKNLAPSTGTVEVSLFNSEESFLKEPYRQQSGTPGEDGEFITEFIDLSMGEYAVVVVHDENDNGKLDAGFLGFGGESYGYSNNVTTWFGRPDYEDVKILTAPEGNLVDIEFD